MPEPTDLAVRRGAQKLLDLVAGVTAADEADLDAMIAEARDRGEAKVAALRRQVLDAEAEAVADVEKLLRVKAMVGVVTGRIPLPGSDRPKPVGRPRRPKVSQVDPPQVSPPPQVQAPRQGVPMSLPPRPADRPPPLPFPKYDGKDVPVRVDPKPRAPDLLPADKLAESVRRVGTWLAIQKSPRSSRDIIINAKVCARYINQILSDPAFRQTTGGLVLSDEGRKKYAA